jgi:transposase InsO family protein
MDIPFKMFSFIKAMREQYPRLSKYKVKIFLDAFCREQGLISRSDSWIGKVIKQNAFFFNTREPVKKQRKSKKQKLRIFRCPKQTDISLGYLQIDGVKVVWEGESLYFLCAVELKSRQAFAERVSSLSSLKAKEFLERILEEVSYPIHTIQTDNGSEFARYFDEALEDLSITHKWSLPHSPKVNGYIERFNGVIQAEFIDYHVDLGVIDKLLFDRKLSEWMIYYNTKRPHHSLGLKTPQYRLLQLQQHITNPQSAKCV